MILILKLVKINFDCFLCHILSGKNNNADISELKVSQCVHNVLALWIAKQADPALGEGVDILKASREVLEERLEKLWGKSWEDTIPERRIRQGGL